MTAFVALLLAQASAPMAPHLSSPAVDVVDVMLDVCVPHAKGELRIGTSPEGDAEALERGNATPGISKASFDRLGPSGSALVSRSVIGERSVGGDAVVIAIGGAVAGCRAILLSGSDERQDDKIADMLIRNYWQEAPTSAHPERSVVRRMFIRRGADKQAYLINLMAGTVPGSDIRLVATANPVPAGVQLPEGF